MSIVQGRGRGFLFIKKPNIAEAKQTKIEKPVYFRSASGCSSAEVLDIIVCFLKHRFWQSASVPCVLSRLFAAAAVCQPDCCAGIFIQFAGFSKYWLILSFACSLLDVLKLDVTFIYSKILRRCNTFFSDLPLHGKDGYFIMTTKVNNFSFFVFKEKHFFLAFPRVLFSGPTVRQAHK